MTEPVTWHYRFDDGPETQVTTLSGLYQFGALAAFVQEDVQKLPEIKAGIGSYEGHVVEIWVPRLLKFSGSQHYGLGFNEFQSLTVTVVSKNEDVTTVEGNE